MRKKAVILTLSLLTLFVSGFAWVTPPKKQMSLTYKQGFKIYKEKILSEYKGVNAVKVQDEQFLTFLDSIEQTITNETSFPDFYSKISECTSRLNDGHVIPFPRLNPVEKAHLLPVDVFMNEEKLYVQKVHSGLLSNVEKGEEIISINGVAIKDVVTEIYKHLSSDGEITSFKKYLLEDNFSAYHYLFVEKSIPEYYKLVLRHPVHGVHRVKIKNDFPISQESRSIRESPYYFEINQDRSYALLTINTFDKRSFKNVGVTFEEVIDGIFKMLGKARIETLIIDIRQNEGGSISTAGELLSYLKKDKQSEDFVHVSFEDKKRSFPIPERKESYFKGKNLIVLTSGKTASIAALFASGARNFAGALLVGEETGGSSKVCSVLDLRKDMVNFSRVVLSFPCGKIAVDYPVQNENRGVIPDLVVEERLSDILNDRDSVLDFVVNECF